MADRNFYEEGIEIFKEAKKRVRKLKFGEPVSNVCAPSNPRFHSYFVRPAQKGRYAQCTDGKGQFWETGSRMIYSGHLTREQANELFTPIWEAEFRQESKGGDDVN